MKITGETIAAMAIQKRTGDEAPAPPVLSVAIDDVAMAALRARAGQSTHCDVCGRPLTGKPSCSGLLMWRRGDELRFDQPPLCPRCAENIGVTAFARWSQEWEEG